MRMLILRSLYMSSVSRRYLKCLPLALLLVITVTGFVNAADNPVAEERLISVMNPTGYAPAIERKSMAARPVSLNGKTVYLVDITFNNGDVFLLEMQKWFANNMPMVKTVFRVKKGAYFADDPELWQEIKANQGLMIMAIGH